jgi:WD40 repeat protein
MMIVLYEFPHILSADDLLLAGCSVKQLKQWGYSKKELFSLHRKDYRISQTMKSVAMYNWKGFTSSAVHPDRIFAPISNHAIGAFDRIGSKWSRNEAIRINCPSFYVTCAALRNGMLIVGGGFNNILLVDWRTGKCLKSIKFSHLSWLETIVELELALDDDIDNDRDRETKSPRMRSASKITGGIIKRGLPSTRIVVCEGLFSNGYAVKIWNLSTCVCEAKLLGHTDSVNQILVLNCGTIITSCKDNGVIIVWQRKRPYSARAKNLSYVRSHTINTKSKGRKITAALKNNLIAALSRDDVISVYDFSVPKEEADYCIKVLQVPHFSPCSICALGDGMTLAAIGYRQLILWDSLTWSQLMAIPCEHKRVICSLTTLSDGITMLSSDSDGIVKLWECYHENDGGKVDNKRPRNPFR